jgi:hypothetical protein
MVACLRAGRARADISEASASALSGAAIPLLTFGDLLDHAHPQVLNRMGQVELLRPTDEQREQHLFLIE